MEATPIKQHKQHSVASIISAMFVTGDSSVALIMENEWRYKYYGPPILGWKNEQEYVDYYFIWLIYANFGVLISIENLLVTA